MGTLFLAAHTFFECTVTHLPPLTGHQSMLASTQQIDEHLPSHPPSQDQARVGEGQITVRQQMSSSQLPSSCTAMRLSTAHCSRMVGSLTSPFIVPTPCCVNTIGQVRL